MDSGGRIHHIENDEHKKELEKKFGELTELTPTEAEHLKVVPQYRRNEELQGSRGFKPKTTDTHLQPHMIPPQIMNDPDPKVKELYLEAYGFVAQTPELKNMNSVKRIAWIQGFMNGALYYRGKFDKMTEREDLLGIQVDQMKIMKTYVDDTITELEKNYEPKDLSAAQEKISVKCSTDNVRDEEGTKES